MEPNIFRELNKIWALSYYAQVPLVIATLILFVQLTFIKNKKPTHLLFWAYALVGVLLFIVIDIYKIFNPKNILYNSRLVESINTIFAILEYISFSYLLYLEITSTSVRKFILLSTFAFTICSIYYSIVTLNGYLSFNHVYPYSIIINIIEFSLLLIPIITYFFELFKEKPILDLSADKLFWLISALFIYCVASLPLLMISNSIANTNVKIYGSLFSIHFVMLSIVMFAVVNYFKCKAYKIAI